MRKKRMTVEEYFEPAIQNGAKAICEAIDKKVLEELIFERTEIIPRGRKLEPGWKSWYCPKCGDGWLYKGRRPKHKNCP